MSNLPPYKPFNISFLCFGEQDLNVFQTCHYQGETVNGQRLFLNVLDILIMAKKIVRFFSQLATSNKS